MVKPEFHNLVKLCGGLRGFSREMAKHGISISHVSLSLWYTSANVHPKKKYFDVCRKIAKSKGVDSSFLR